MIISLEKELGLQDFEKHFFQLFAVIIIDYIWKQRNGIVHNHSSLYIEEAKLQLGCIYQNYKEDWKGKQEKKNEEWRPPPSDYFSYTFDAATRDTFLAISVIRRNQFGDILEIQTEKFLCPNPLVAEASTTLLATKMANSSRQSRVIFE